MKVITIRMTDVEAAMLQELVKKKSGFRDAASVLISLIRSDYEKMR